MTRKIKVIRDLDASLHFVEQAGLAHVYLGKMPDPAYPWHLSDLCKVTDWAKGKRSSHLLAALREEGWSTELRYDAAHGCRYGLVVWHSTLRDEAARRVTLAAHDGIHDLRQYALDSGIPEEELP